MAAILKKIGAVKPKFITTIHVFTPTSATLLKRFKDIENVYVTLEENMDNAPTYFTFRRMECKDGHRCPLVCNCWQICMWRSKLQRSETTGLLAANNPLRLFEHTLSAQRIRQNDNVVCRLGSRHVRHIFCILLSQLSSGFWHYALSPGLAISASVCLDFAFHLLSSVRSFSWPHLYLAFANVQTISTSSICRTTWHVPNGKTYNQINCIMMSQ